MMLLSGKGYTVVRADNTEPADIKHARLFFAPRGQRMAAPRFARMGSGRSPAFVCPTYGVTTLNTFDHPDGPPVLNARTR